ncbi:MAG: hypothetical protein M3R68_09890, partial [Acidobacteriota bacterium]|nr:hypothetical protein [Acidobacteriota bacterium]
MHPSTSLPLALFIRTLAVLLILSIASHAQDPKKPKPPTDPQQTQPLFQFPDQQVPEQGKKPEQTPANGSQSPILNQFGLRAKRAGFPRIGIATTIGAVPPEQDDAVRAQIYEMLYGNRETSAAEAVLLREKLDRSIFLEAKMTGCDYLLLLSLDSTIKPASQKGNGLVRKAIQAGGQAVGITSANTGYTELARVTYRGYQIANSLQNSDAHLDSITRATDKKDRVSINYRFVNVANNEAVVPQTTKERIALKKQEPILQNVLIEIGNQILNSIPASTAGTSAAVPENGPVSPTGDNSGAVQSQSKSVVPKTTNQPAIPSL